MIAKSIVHHKTKQKTGTVAGFFVLVMFDLLTAFLYFNIVVVLHFF